MNIVFLFFFEAMRAREIWDSGLLITITKVVPRATNTYSEKEINITLGIK